MKPRKEHELLLAEARRMLAEPPQRRDEAGDALSCAHALWVGKQWQEATKAFGKVALAYPHENPGILAAMLYIEGLSLLGSLSEPSAASCYDELADRLPVLQRLYCERGENRRHPQECRTLLRIEWDLEPKGCCCVPAPQTEPLSVLYARGGARYLAFARRCVGAALLAGVSPMDDRCDDFALNAVRAFAGVPDEARVREARALLLDPANGMLKSPGAKQLAR